MFETEAELDALQAMLDAQIRLVCCKGFTLDSADMVQRLEAEIDVFRPRVVYLDVLAKKFHSTCMYDPDPDHIAGRLQDHWYIEKPTGYSQEVTKILKPFCLQGDR